MPITPFRATAIATAPPFLSTGTGERLLYAFGLATDATMEMAVQGTKLHIPLVISPYTGAVLNIPPADAQAQQGADRGITRGINESALSYATRLQRAYESWQFAGTARGFLSQLLGYLLAYTPRALAVSSQYDPSTYPPTRLSSSWDVYPVGRDPNSEPMHTYVSASGGNWDWDSLSQVTGSYTWWAGWIVIFAVAPQDFVHPAATWGSGPMWGNDSAWGLTETTDVGRSLQIIAGQFKAATTWVRGLVISFDATLFDPAQPVGGGINPDGFFAKPYKVVGGVAVSSRFANAVYGPEVV